MLLSNMYKVTWRAIQYCKQEKTTQKNDLKICRVDVNSNRCCPKICQEDLTETLEDAACSRSPLSPYSFCIVFSLNYLKKLIIVTTKISKRIQSRGIRRHEELYNKQNSSQQRRHLIYKKLNRSTQQARSGSFGLHAAAALASNHIGHHHSHHQAQQTSVGNVAAQLHHPQQLHQQQQHLSGQVASADQQMHQLTSPPVISASQQHHQPHLSQLCTEQNHHLLFNAAAAAAAAAHLSGVVSKSHELDSTNITQDEDNNDILSGNKSRNGNNNECSSAATKQELSAIPGCSNNLLPTANNGTHTDNNIHHEQSLQLQTVQQQQQPLKYEHEACTSNNLPLEALQQQLQQQVQHQEQQISADKAERDSGIQSDKHIANSLHASHHHNMQQEHHQRHSQQTQLTVNAVGRSGDTSHNESPTHLQQLRMQSLERRSSPDTQPPTLPLHSEDPLQINTFAKNGPTTTSPQPSLNSASGGSSTPDLKFNSENNKVPGELQVSISISIGKCGAVCFVFVILGVRAVRVSNYLFEEKPIILNFLSAPRLALDAIIPHGLNRDKFEIN
ncbi:hypothetical protein GQX74_015573 [Glossina fuscipes]|nr:hypothetical protein GQX74_015573 [Glossina fuscipes]